MLCGLSYTGPVSSLKTEPVVILLAAGSGDRLGEDKMFADLGGKPLIERTLRPYRKAAQVGDIIIVVPPGASERFDHLRSPERHLVENPDPSRGMISSIRAGLESGWAAERNFMIAPADVPFVKVATIDRLVKTFMTRDCKIVIPAYKGLGGHPAVFDQSLYGDFFAHGDSSGTREILMRYQTDTVRLNIQDPDICYDIDTPKDLELGMDEGVRWARVELEADEKKRARLR